jgi:hypothetical protein
MTTGRAARGVATACRIVLLLLPWLLAAVFPCAAAARDGGTPAARQGPPPRAVILVLAPGASFADWRKGITAVQGGRLPATATAAPALAVMPTRPGPGDPREAPYRMLATGTRSPAGNRTALTLGETLRRAGVRTVAVGGEGAAIVAGTDRASRHGRVRRDEAPHGRATDPDALARAALDAVANARAANRSVLVVAGFDDLARADRYSAVALPEATREQRRDALRRLDRLISRLARGGAGAGDAAAALLVVTPIPAADAAARQERLGPLALFRDRGGPAAGVDGAGAHPAAALLTSPSTRGTPGLVAATDIATTVTTLLGLPPQKPAGGGVVGAGRAMRVVGVPRGSDGAAAAASYLAGRVAAWSAQAREQRLLVAVPWMLAGALLLAAWCVAATPPNGAQPTSRRKALARGLGLWAAAVPAALLAAAPLAPVAPPGSPGTVYAIALGISGVPPLLHALLRSPARTVLRIVCALTTLLLALDGWFGAPLLGRSPLSYSVIEAARFYGIGNEASGVLLGASLVAVGGAAAARGAWPAVIGGLSVALSLGLPGLGADFGGLVAAVAGFAVLAARSPRSRSTPPPAARAAALAAAGVALIVFLVLLDARRDPERRTHIGHLAAQAAARGGGTAGAAEMARRKVTTNWRLLTTSPWAALLLAEVAAAALLLLPRWRRRPSGAGGESASWAAVATAGAVVFLVNDSGVVAAATCLLYGVSACLLPARTADDPGAPAPDETNGPPGR